jgi:hypothetical protein
VADLPVLKPRQVVDVRTLLRKVAADVHLTPDEFLAPK